MRVTPDSGGCRARQPLCALVLLLLMMLPFVAALAQPGVSATEYDLKAIFLFRFSQFVDWPPTSFTTAEAPFVIGVLGDDPFGARLDEAVRGERVNSRAVVVQRYRRLEDVGACQILFVAPSERSNFTAILASLQGRSILTVGDSEDFARSGGMIHFLTVDNKIRLRINLDAARAANLAISSKLLRTAELVSEKS